MLNFPAISIPTSFSATWIRLWHHCISIFLCYSVHGLTNLSFIWPDISNVRYQLWYLSWLHNKWVWTDNGSVYLLKSNPVELLPVCFNCSLNSPLHQQLLQKYRRRPVLHIHKHTHTHSTQLLHKEHFLKVNCNKSVAIPVKEDELLPWSTQ